MHLPRSALLLKTDFLIATLCRFSCLIALAWSFAPAARANVVNARYTWIGQDRATLGMLHKDASSVAGRWGWSTNGNDFDCAEIYRNDFEVAVSCPRINYLFHLFADRATVDAPGGNGQQVGPGQWDDRRFWFGSAAGGNAPFTERFSFKDNFKWAEDQYANNQQVGHFDFIETGRDADFIYLYDASRSTSVAIGLKEVFVKNTTNVPNWTKFYSGSF